MDSNGAETVIDVTPVDFVNGTLTYTFNDLLPLTDYQLSLRYTNTDGEEIEAGIVSVSTSTETPGLLICVDSFPVALEYRLFLLWLDSKTKAVPCLMIFRRECVAGLCFGESCDLCCTYHWLSALSVHFEACDLPSEHILFQLTVCSSISDAMPCHIWLSANIMVFVFCDFCCTHFWLPILCPVWSMWFTVWAHSIVSIVAWL